MKKELEEYQKAYANAMKHDIDYYSDAVLFKDIDSLPDWVEVQCHVEGVLIDFSFKKSRAVFAEHNFRGNADTIMEYYFTDEEFNKVRNKVKGIVQRNKGLGSLSAEQAHNSMFIQENQHIDTLIPNETTLPLLMSLMGKDSEPKHDFIFENLDFSEIRE